SAVHRHARTPLARAGTGRSGPPRSRTPSAPGRSGSTPEASARPPGALVGLPGVAVALTPSFVPPRDLSPAGRTDCSCPHTPSIILRARPHRGLGRPKWLNDRLPGKAVGGLDQGDWGTYLGGVPNSNPAVWPSHTLCSRGTPEGDRDGKGTLEPRRGLRRPPAPRLHPLRRTDVFLPSGQTLLVPTLGLVPHTPGSRVLRDGNGTELI